MPDQNPSAAAIITQQIRFISDIVVELKAMIKTLDERMRLLELSEAGCQAVSQSKMEAAHKRLDDNRKVIDELDTRVFSIEKKLPQIDELLGIKNKLLVLVALSGFVGTAVGGLVITFIFTMLVEGL